MVPAFLDGGMVGLTVATLGVVLDAPTVVSLVLGAVSGVAVGSVVGRRAARSGHGPRPRPGPLPADRERELLRASRGAGPIPEDEAGRVMAERLTERQLGLPGSSRLMTGCFLVLAVLYGVLAAQGDAWIWVMCGSFAVLGTTRTWLDRRLRRRLAELRARAPR